MLAALADAARGATVTPLPASVAGRLNGVAFVRGGSSTLVLWSASNTPVTVPAAPGGRTGAVGSPLGAAGGGTTVTGRSRPAPRRPAGGRGSSPPSANGPARVRASRAGSARRALCGAKCAPRRVPQCRGQLGGAGVDATGVPGERLGGEGRQAEEAQDVAVRAGRVGVQVLGAMRRGSAPRGTCANHRPTARRNGPGRRTMSYATPGARRGCPARPPRARASRSVLRVERVGEGQRLDPVRAGVQVVRVGPLDRVTQQCDEPGLRQGRRDPGRHARVEQVVGARLEACARPGRGVGSAPGTSASPDRSGD